MLEITIDNCYKFDLETINDPNNIFVFIEEISKLKLTQLASYFW